MRYGGIIMKWGCYILPILPINFITLQLPSKKNLRLMPSKIINKIKVNYIYNLMSFEKLRLFINISKLCNKKNIPPSIIILIENVKSI